MSVAELPIGIQLPQDKFAKPQRESKAVLDVCTLVDRALSEPLAYPPLKDSVFPGDKVVIVVHADLPAPNEIINAITKYLHAAHVPSIDITILTAMELEIQPSDAPDLATFIVHDSNDKHAVAYIAASDNGDPVYVNRLLFDADVILPINCASHSEEINEDCVYPRFSSAATLSRFHQNKGSKKSRLAEVTRANEFLGIFMSLEVVSGPGGQVQEIIFGRKELANRNATHKAEASWAVSKQAATQLIVATMESNPQRQTWEQFCQALIAADQVADDSDQIVVCSAIAIRPGNQIRQVLQLQFETDPEAAGKFLKNSSPTHRNVAEILSEKTVYLKSRLSKSVVEELGLGYIESSEDLQRLIDRVDSGVLLRDAHLCRIVTT